MVMYVVLLTSNAKYILWMDDHSLILTYESLATGYLKCYTLNTA